MFIRSLLPGNLLKWMMLARGRQNRDEMIVDVIAMRNENADISTTSGSSVKMRRIAVQKP